MPDPFTSGKLGKSHPTAKTEERRRSERHPFSAVADVLEPISKAGVSVRIADLSLNGCYADSLTVFPIGTTVSLSIRHSGRHFESLARVVYAKTGMGMGLSFENLPAEMQSMLREWLSSSQGNVATLFETSPVGHTAQEPPQPHVTMRKEKLILNRLIELMMYKGQLTELEGRELLQQLQQER
jgi:PilZ domain